MKWEGNRESSNVEDRRGSGGGGGGGLLGGRGIGVGTIVIALVGGWIFGINPLTILGVIFRQRREISRLKRSASAHKPAATDVVVPPPL